MTTDRRLLALLTAAAFLAAVPVHADIHVETFVTQTEPCLASVRLAWDPNPEADLAGYTIHWGAIMKTYDGGIATLARTDPGQPIATTYTVTGLPCGTRRFFAARAFDTENRFSGYSNELSVLTPAAPAVVPTRAPAPPPTTTARPVP
jgi:hypothetical protein